MEPRVLRDARARALTLYQQLNFHSNDNPIDVIARVLVEFYRENGQYLASASPELKLACRKQREAEAELAKTRSKLAGMVTALSEYAKSSNWTTLEGNSKTGTDYACAWIGPNRPYAPEALAKNALTADIMELSSKMARHERDSVRLARVLQVLEHIVRSIQDEIGGGENDTGHPSPLLSPMPATFAGG